MMSVSSRKGTNCEFLLRISDNITVTCRVQPTTGLNLALYNAYTRMTKPKFFVYSIIFVIEENRGV